MKLGLLRFRTHEICSALMMMLGRLNFKSSFWKLIFYMGEKREKKYFVLSNLCWIYDHHGLDDQMVK